MHTTAILQIFEENSTRLCISVILVNTFISTKPIIVYLYLIVICENEHESNPVLICNVLLISRVYTEDLRKNNVPFL